MTKVPPSQNTVISLPVSVWFGYATLNQPPSANSHPNLKTYVYTCVYIASSLHAATSLPYF